MNAASRLRISDLNDPSQSRLLISSMLCNDSKNTDGVEIGDPTETALINLGRPSRTGSGISA